MRIAHLRFYGDWCAGRLWATKPYAQGEWISYDMGSVGGFSYTGFAEGDDGELYVAGRFSLLQISGPTNLLFNDGFEIGDPGFWSTIVL